MWDESIAVKGMRPPDDPGTLFFSHTWGKPPVPGWANQADSKAGRREEYTARNSRPSPNISDSYLCGWLAIFSLGFQTLYHPKDQREKAPVGHWVSSPISSRAERAQ